MSRFKMQCATYRSCSRSSDSSDNSVYEEDAGDENPPKEENTRQQNDKYKYTSSYFNYLSEFRSQQDKNLSAVEVARKAGRAWNRLTPGEREPYERAAAANREKRGKVQPGIGRVAKAREARNKKKKKNVVKNKKKGVKK